jgi:hypothetical protein
VAGHEETDCRIGKGESFAVGTAMRTEQAVACFMFMANVGEYVNDSSLMNLRRIASKYDVYS